MFRFGCSVQVTFFRLLERARRLPGGRGVSVFFYFNGPPLYVRDTLLSRLSGVTNLHVGDTLCRGRILRPTLRRLPVEGSLPVALPRRQHRRVDDGQSTHPISKAQGKLADDWSIYWKVLSLVADSHRQAKNPLRLHPIVMHPLPMTPFAYLPRTDCDMQSRNPHWSPDSPGASPTRQSQQMAGAMVTGGQASWEPLEHPPTDTSTPARIPASPAQAPLALHSDVTHLRAKRAVKKSKERIGSTSARQPTAPFPFLPPAARCSCRLPCTFVAAFFALQLPRTAPITHHKSASLRLSLGHRDGRSRSLSHSDLHLLCEYHRCRRRELSYPRCLLGSQPRDGHASLSTTLIGTAHCQIPHASRAAAWKGRGFALGDTVPVVRRAHRRLRVSRLRLVREAK